MTRQSPARRLFASLITAATFAALPIIGAPAALAQPAADAPAPAAQIATVGDLSRQVWSDARSGRMEEAIKSLRALPEDSTDPSLVRLRSLPEMLEQNRAKQAEERAAKIAEAEESLAAELVKPETASTLSAALKHAVELHVLALPEDKDAILAQPRIRELIAKAEAAAHKAEAERDWLTANELFYRLSVLLDEKGAYADDLKRLGHRLNMIRLFVPERFYELRNQARINEGKDPLPPYNGLGEDYRQKLAGVTTQMVLTAIDRAATYHVDHNTKGHRDLLIGGLDSVRTMVTTTDLEPVFPKIADAGARQKMLDFIDARKAELAARTGNLNRFDVIKVLEDLMRVNRTSVALPEAALLREFGDGAMAQLDEFTAIVWPDEVARFERMTQGKLKGVGIQIQLDEATQLIKVVTPLEGTPAQRAGVRGGDLIKKINGQSAAGLTLQQAVDLITGEPNTKVTITMERVVGKDDEGKDVTRDIDFTLAREVIPLHSVKGWRRLGVKEDEWDWFIDPESKIGYIRLSQFQDDTTEELHQAIREMKAQGLEGLILDLRFNPGGLLTQAVSVANTFIPSGTIVSTTGDDRAEVARPRGAVLQGVPLAVLINEGAASASEIVAGAIKHYADKGDIQAIVIGERSYGKGSVQNVYGLTSNSLLKLTTQHYRLPDGTIIHRKQGQETWGVDPHVRLNMLPDQISEALLLRQNADVIEIDENNQRVEGAEPPPDPNRLITEGIDLQLQYALVLLQTQAIPASVEHVRIDAAALAEQRPTP